MGGFLKWHTHANLAATYESKRTSKTRTCCYEMKWINSKLLTGNFNAPKEITPIGTEYKWDGLSEDKCENQFDKFIHDIHLRCANEENLDLKSTKHKLKVCKTDLTPSVCSFVSVRTNEHPDVKAEVTSKLGCSFLTLDAKNGEATDEHINKLKELKGSSVLEVALDLKTVHYMESLMNSFDFGQIKQLILTVS